MNILFLNRSFWPDLESTGQVFTELCEDLSALGHEITFVSGPSYHVGSSPRFPWARESHGKIRIVRTWGSRLPKKRLAARFVNLGSYYSLATLAAWGLNKPDVIVAGTDPPLLGALAAILKRRWKCRLVYSVRDLYPDIAEATGGVRSRSLLKLLDTSNRIAYRAADLIIPLANDMAHRIISKGVPSAKVKVIPDWVDCEQIRPLETTQFRDRRDGKFVIMYSGNLGLSQGLERVLEAAAALSSDPRIVFDLIGEGARKQWLQERAGALGLRNVRFLPYRPKESLGESLAAADLHLIPLAPGTAGCLVPSKIYGILAAGRPFVAMMEEHAEVASLANLHRVGMVVEPSDAGGLERAIRYALENPAELKLMGQRARVLAEEKFERKIVTRQFADALSEVMRQVRVC